MYSDSKELVDVPQTQSVLDDVVHGTYNSRTTESLDVFDINNIAISYDCGILYNNCNNDNVN